RVATAVHLPMSAIRPSWCRAGRSTGSRRSTPCCCTCSGIRSTSRWESPMSSEGVVCPLPISATDRVLLGHGSGGKLTAELIERLILPAFANPALDALDDQAVLAAPEGRIAFTTDSYVVNPIF